MGLFRKPPPPPKKSGLSGIVALGVIGFIGYSLVTNPTALHKFEQSMKNIHPAVALAQTKGGTYSCSELESLWTSQGGSSSKAFIAAEVARAESSGISGAKNYNKDGTIDWGLWQINTVNGGNDSSLDPAYNARQAISVSKDGTDWSPWVTYKRGAEYGQC